MKVQMFTVGKFFTNCYAVVCEETKDSIVIDPGFDEIREAEETLKFLDGNVSAIKYIVNTHGHSDHTCGNALLKERFHAPILIHEYDAHLLGPTSERIGRIFGIRAFSPPPDILLREGDQVKFGKVNLKVVHTPGHSRGGMCLLGEELIFTGDTLFAGSIGRIDFPESSSREMKCSLKKLKGLSDHLSVYPGHGPSTNLKVEKETNPFLQDAFEQIF